MNKKNILAIWEKETVKGEKYLYIKLEGDNGYSVIAFKNKKTNDKQPDYVATQDYVKVLK